MILVSQHPFLSWTRRAAPAPQVTHRFTLQLREGSSEVIAQPSPGVSVRCKRGRIWITYDGDPKDVVLEAGQGCVAEPRGCMTLHAVRESDVEMQFSRV